MRSSCLVVGQFEAPTVSNSDGSAVFSPLVNCVDPDHTVFFVFLFHNVVAALYVYDFSLSAHFTPLTVQEKPAIFSNTGAYDASEDARLTIPSTYMESRDDDLP